MIPILFEFNTWVYQNNQGKLNHGIGDLVECTECSAMINEDGEFELELTYPMTGALFKELTIDRIVLARVPYSKRASEYQAFRIYGYEKNFDGTMTVKCQHVSYDMADIPVKSFDKVSQYGSMVPINQSLQAMKALMDNVPLGVTNPFNYTGTSINSTQSNSHLRSYVSGSPHTEDNTFKVEEPQSMRAILLDGDESIKGCWGGDLIYDNFVVSLYQTGGFDNGITLEYGIDITDLTLEEEISELTTGVLPYWKGEIPDPNAGANSSDTIEKTVYGSIRYASEYDNTLVFNRQKIAPLDLSEFFEEDSDAPTDMNKETNLINRLNAKALEWMAAEETGQPEFTVTIKYANFNSDGYSEYLGASFIPGILYFTRTGQVPPYTYTKTTDQTKQENKTYYTYTGNIKDIRLYDAVRILFPKMGIAVKAKVSSYKYDVLAEQCTEIEVTHGRNQSKWKGLEDASRLKRGLIPPSRIGNRSIQNNQIATGAVAGRAIATGGVTGGKIGKDAVDTDNVKDGAVKEEKVANNAITVYKIKDDAIESTKIKNGAVTGNKVLDQAIAYAKLDGTLQLFYSNTIACNTLVGNYLEAGTGLNAPYALVTSSILMRYLGSTLGFSPKALLYTDNNGNSAGMVVLGAYTD